MTDTTDTERQIEAWRLRFEGVLASTLPGEELRPSMLHTAMRYSTLSGGKRIRPLLAYAGGQALGLGPQALDPIASAIELMHAYSLIHDDLPAMDDDEWRRGRPTCHIRFGEAIAILAGDALQALSFQVVARGMAAQPRAAVRLACCLAEACGSMGMAGGQVLDLAAAGTSLPVRELEQVHELKTGRLIGLAVTAAAEILEVGPAVLEPLKRFGCCIGLGFQIRDDILDVIGHPDRTGKASHADELLGKPNFPAVVGLEESVRRATDLLEESLACLAQVPGDTRPLAWLAQHMIERDR